jgi:predicted ATPase
MKKLLITGALCAGWGLVAHAQQGLSTWLEELTALRTLEQTVSQGYKITTSGIRNIGDLRSEEYQLHQAYYGGFETVSTAVADDPKTVELENLLQTLEQRLTSELKYWRNQTPIDQP